MNQWKYVKLGEVCTIERGGSPRPIDDFITTDENGINWIKIGDADESMYITKTAQRIKPMGMKKSRYVKPGDFLLSNSMSFGRPYILKIDGCIHDGWLVLRDENNVFDKKFLYYYLSAPITYKRFKSMAVGGVVNNLNSDMVRKVRVPIPSQEEQHQISDRLDKVSNLIFLRKQQLAKLDELVKARFVEMFGSYPENENAYPVVNVSEIADAGVGVVIKPAQYYVTEECGVKAFRSLNIGEMYIKDSDWVYFSTEGNENNKKSQLHENDLLIVRSGAPGTSCVVTKEFEGCNAVDVIIAHPDLSKVNPWYLCAYINYPHGKKQIEEGTGGAAQQHFNVGKCNNLKILLPPLEPQNQFAAFVERVNQQKQTVQQSLEKLELMKKALMQEYFG